MKTIKLPFGLTTLRKIQFPRKLGLLERIYGSSLSMHGIAWVNTSTNIDWKLDLAIVNHRWIVFGDYEGTPQMDWIRNWLKDGGTIIDSGANIGQMALYFLSCRKTYIYCVEPIPNCAEWIKDCIESGSFQERVTILQCLFDKSAGEVELLVVGPGKSKEWSTVHTDWFQNLNTDVIKCKSITFDTLIETNRINSVRLWKLDVEGGELRALYGATNSLEHQIIEALIIEVHPENETTLIELMASFGYFPFKFTSVGSGGTGGVVPAENWNSITSGNCLFLPKT